MPLPPDAAAQIRAFLSSLLVDENGVRLGDITEDTQGLGEAARRMFLNAIKLYPNGVFDIGRTTYSTFDQPATFSGNVFFDGRLSSTTNATSNVTTIIGNELRVGANTTHQGTLGFGAAPSGDADVLITRVGARSLSVGDSANTANGALTLRQLTASNVNVTGLTVNALSVNVATVNVLTTNTAVVNVANVQTSMTFNFAANVEFKNSLGVVDTTLRRANGGYLSLLSANPGTGLYTYTTGDNNARILMCADATGLGFGPGNAVPDVFLSRANSTTLAVGNGTATFTHSLALARLYANNISFHNIPLTLSPADGTTLAVGTGNGDASHNIRANTYILRHAGAVQFEVASGNLIVDSALSRSNTASGVGIHAIVNHANGHFGALRFGESFARSILAADGNGLGLGNGSVFADVFLSRANSTMLAVGTGGGNASKGLLVANLGSSGTLTANLATIKTLTCNVANSFNGTLEVIAYDTTYQATTDGFLIARLKTSGGTAGFVIYIDTVSPPDAGGWPIGSLSGNGITDTVTVPIPKGYYYKIVATGGAFVDSAITRFMPMGKAV